MTLTSVAMVRKTSPHRVRRPGTPVPHHRRRVIAYAQTGALGQNCLAWHQGVVAMGRDELVDGVVDLFARIAAPRQG